MQRAFDKVDHGILLNKIKIKIGVWIHNFLSNRQQCVAINETTSSEAHVRSGVPQGSVLGPLLFLGVESVSVAGALSHADTFEISCHSPTRVLLSVQRLF